MPLIRASSAFGLPFEAGHNSGICLWNIGESRESNGDYIPPQDFSHYCIPSIDRLYEWSTSITLISALWAFNSGFPPTFDQVAWCFPNKWISGFATPLPWKCQKCAFRNSMTSQFSPFHHCMHPHVPEHEAHPLPYRITPSVRHRAIDVHYYYYYYYYPFHKLFSTEFDGAMLV